MPNIPCSHKILIFDKSSKKNKIQKIFLILNSTLEELFNDTTHISLRWIYRSAKIDWTKKPIWVYSSSPTIGSEQKSNLVKCLYLYCSIQTNFIVSHLRCSFFLKKNYIFFINVDNINMPSFVSNQLVFNIQSLSRKKWQAAANSFYFVTVIGCCFFYLRVSFGRWNQVGKLNQKKSIKNNQCY